ncbi:putative O-methyltransferase YrrM [Prauserella shujinwangii]|uniref:Putative O-methyltransferase YrrM n=1 Tax=Prauserella shujinwangii TaxID=1453103 RepID=A0A2T0LTS9_9PSEU|nr:O-methyltransferase [Prauserella shujinwangii]PRX47147.1 putative O-methyltransferase YrrM [Prauserella shujinwangii]
MTQDTWTAVDAFLSSQLVSPDSALDAALEASHQAGLPPIAVSPNEGKLLYLLARIARARAILEIGTLGGYSTIWLGRALPPDGRLVTLEAEQAHADVARRNVDRAGLTGVVDIRVGRALDTLPTLRGDGLFDLVFVDADKQSNPDYFRWALELTRPGSVIVVDNVVRSGAITERGSEDPAIRGTQYLFELMAAEPRVEATALQTVGAKGHDGLAIALVTG